MAAGKRTEISDRLERIRKLCDDLEEARSDTLKYRRLIQRIRDEADSFQKTLGSHDRDTSGNE